MNSLSKVADDYIPGVTPGLGLRAKSELTNRLSESKIKKDLSSFSQRSFLEEAQTLFVRFQRAFASGDASELREIVSPTMMTRTKNMLGKRVFRAGESTVWEGRIVSAKLLTVEKRKSKEKKILKKKLSFFYCLV